MTVISVGSHQIFIIVGISREYIEKWKLSEEGDILDYCIIKTQHVANNIVINGEGTLIGCCVSDCVIIYNDNLTVISTIQKDSNDLPTNLFFCKENNNMIIVCYHNGLIAVSIINCPI
jgi:hypothetical protein